MKSQKFRVSRNQIYLVSSTTPTKVKISNSKLSRQANLNWRYPAAATLLFKTFMRTRRNWKSASAGLWSYDVTSSHKTFSFFIGWDMFCLNLSSSFLLNVVAHRLSESPLLPLKGLQNVRNQPFSS